MKVNTQKGFTLIELLVVIVIVGILAGAVLIAVNPGEMSARARDSKRQSDMDTVKRGLDLSIVDAEVELVDTTGLRSQDGLGNAATTSCSGTPECLTDGWVRVEVVGDEGLAKYLPALPVDPRSNDSYFYMYESDGDVYQAVTYFETDEYREKYNLDGSDCANAYQVGTGVTGLTCPGPQ